ncbi:orotate phosphoribosyltransferase [Alkalihalobacillus alcalophilus ATCC 27647 = CGMCC 1.3604]|uniref:Orotate phosphoribosyltransferase n=1 Tax=Alkalihalobacillus alcalophilus ATCC 27647 = CGMCC 1.3604 TaxID=1218173 RepID=A0A094WLQ7_ALKAL|nr:orotate phosphoribosyltransferase [Alkalihalobacillus alcalophilus]KGA97751.1 orotate phosphoribosyltransferase [Alkalihalobacillus alcalophilus ATCC 27647 = CGMCC 1.3604]MED1563141.1 orotate phosphoribosyltransferase [Alkalihalobacillus alcalophilus]THG89237.1 orotate phosphoribosyltransferase [Alkalihalobacillus alcalophilus ATCC 27647 = CGMCC 1.3604]
MKKQIAEHLLNIEAVSLSPNEPFTWSSGLKSPIYCDNRLTMSYPVVRKEIAKGLAALIKEQYGEVEVVAGTATAGIPHAAWVSEELDLPMAYIRGKAKSHGKQSQIEGKIEKGQKVVIVEDLISTGGSAITSAKAIRESGAEVLGVVAIFTYELDKATANLAEAELEVAVLSNYSTLVEVAKEKGTISDKEWEKLTQWRKDPSDEAWVHI